MRKNLTEYFVFLFDESTQRTVKLIQNTTHLKFKIFICNEEANIINTILYCLHRRRVLNVCIYCFQLLS